MHDDLWVGTEVVGEPQRNKYIEVHRFYTPYSDKFAPPIQTSFTPWINQNSLLLVAAYYVLFGVRLSTY